MKNSLPLFEMIFVVYSHVDTYICGWLYLVYITLYLHKENNKLTFMYKKYVQWNYQGSVNKFGKYTLSCKSPIHITFLASVYRTGFYVQHIKHIHSGNRVQNILCLPFCFLWLCHGVRQDTLFTAKSIMWMGPKMLWDLFYVVLGNFHHSNFSRPLLRAKALIF